jgi:adenine-specific DNA-methyltransferase
VDRIPSKRVDREKERVFSQRPITVEVSDYRYEREKRKNIPDAGLATYNYKSEEPAKYSYDPHLAPQLIWAGKSERAAFEVETVSLHIHERVSTRAILKSVERAEQFRRLRLFADPDLPFDKRIEFYKHEMDWTNRLILGDSLLVMNSLLERELMEGKVQMIYVDPPYGIKYSSNFQPRINKRDVRDADDDLTREPEQIQAYRDTWELGVHSYLTYLRDRLRLCRDMLADAGSIFVQISDENVHRVRLLMDEVFGEGNFCSLITLQKTTTATSGLLPVVNDYVLWYAKNKKSVKYHQLFSDKRGGVGIREYQWVELHDGKRRKLTADEQDDIDSLSKDSRLFRQSDLTSQGWYEQRGFNYEFEGDTFRPGSGRHWSISKEGLDKMAQLGRLVKRGTSLAFVRYLDDQPVFPISNNWNDVAFSSRSEDKLYVVQTSEKAIERCLLMTTDPGDLVFDPTSGSGTTAICAEKWGRRWITCDTSRVALAIARQRLMTAVFNYYKLADIEKGLSAGFVYKTVPHITLRTVAQNEPAEQEVLVDNPLVERGIVRVTGPFTVEAIPAPGMQAGPSNPSQPSTVIVGDYVQLTLDLLRKSGITFPRGKHMILENLRPIASAGFVHAEGEAGQNGGKIRVAISLGPRYGPITAKQVDEAIRSSYRMQFDVLVFAGFAFDTEAQAVIQKNPIPKLSVQMAHISPDVIVGEYSSRPLLKTTKSSQIFTVFGEPDVKVEKRVGAFTVKVIGVDVYDPTTGEVHSSDVSDIPAWFLDEDYDGYNFRICQAFFPKEATAKNPWEKLENALRGIVDKQRMNAFRGAQSLPFELGEQQQIAVKVIDIRGNEVTVVTSLNGKAPI